MASKRSRSKETIGNRILYLESQLAKASSREREAYTLEIQQLRAEMGKIDRGSVGTEQLGAVNEINSDSNFVARAPEDIYFFPGAQVLPASGESSPLSIGSDGKVSFAAPATMEIPGSADLDDYVLPGIYHQSSNTDTNTGFNYPVLLSGLLEVHSRNDGVFVYQRYTVYGSSTQIYYRTRHLGTWSTWETVSDSTHTHDFVMPTKLGTAAPSTYPLGYSLLTVGTDSTWPADLLTVATHKGSASFRAGQVAYRKASGQTWTRSEGDGDTWSSWFESSGPGGDTSYGNGLIKIKPTGGTNLTISSNGDVVLNSGAADHRIYGCFPSEFRWFKLVIQYSTASQAGLNAQLIDGTTVSTAAEYDHGVASNGASTTFAGSTTDNSTAWIFDGGASGHFHNVSVDIMDVNFSGATFWNGTMMTRRTATPSLTSAAVRGGLHQLGTAYDGLRLVPSTGTGGGRIQIYGYR